MAHVAVDRPPTAPATGAWPHDRRPAPGSTSANDERDSSPEAGDGSGLTTAQRMELERLCDRRIVEAGDIVLREGERRDELFFLEDGVLDVLKRDADGMHSHTIAEVQPGRIFGELSFVDRRGASATIRARTRCSILLLPYARIQGRDIESDVMRRICAGAVERLRDTSEQYTERLSDALRMSRERNRFGQIYVMTIMLFGVQQCLLRIPHDLPPLARLAVSWGFLLLIALPLLHWICRFHIPIAEFGLTLRGWKPAAIEGVFAAVALAPALLLLRWLQAPDGEPLVTWQSLSQGPLILMVVSLLLYLPHALIQELVARGVLQGALQRFMSDEPVALPIFSVSAMFGIMHLHISMAMGLLTFVAGLLFGTLYVRHGNLVGITIAHYALGILCIALGYL